MSEQRRVGIIGAGVAGLACARQLADAGWSPVLFDKGRGVGGRMATRRAEGDAQFDHGAQYFTARTRVFRDVIHGMTDAGAIARWDDGNGNTRFVGTPGMSAFAKQLAKGLDVRQGIKVTELQRLNNKWVLITDSVSHLFDRVVVTVPVPQAVALLGAYESLVSEIKDVRFEPCLTLMARFRTHVPQQFSSRSDPGDALAWIAHDSTKPGRPGENCWVAQASPMWSAEHLELDLKAIEALMLPLLCERIGIALDDVVHATAHRWRYARVVNPLGQPFACAASGTVYAGGDWCLGARVEAAWESGDAIARNIVGIA